MCYVCVYVCGGERKNERDLNQYYVSNVFVKCFTFFNSFNLLNSPMKKVPSYSFFK